MVLAQAELRSSVVAKEIRFEPPLEENQWGQASVDLRLGFSFTKIKQDIRSVKVSISDGLGELGEMGFWNTIILKERDDLGKIQTFSLEPGEFVLAMTYERVTIPSNLVAIVEGRSTYARAGISMHQTAPWIQRGWSGQIVLEMVNQGPLTIELTPIKDRPCQLSFFQLTSTLPDDLLYGSRPTDSYQSQTHPLKRR
ncbi:MAG: dCTP deaminase [Actinomycetota bacterium]